MNIEFCEHHLIAAILLQAVKDFVQGSEQQRKEVLKDLRSDHMYALAGDTSLIIAEQLEKHPKEVCARMCKHMHETTLI